MNTISPARAEQSGRAGRLAVPGVEFWPALIAGSTALALYMRTLAPGLTWSHDGADGGDFLAAALAHGVPHPPGYPVYMILLQATLKLFDGIAAPARIGNFLSAFLAAAAVALLADLARRSLPHTPWRNPLALVAALAWAASPALWGQAVITEVYTLQALLGTALLWLLWRWRAAVVEDRQRSTPQPAAWRWLVLAGAVAGLALGTHLSMIVMFPGIAAWLWSNRQGLAGTPRWGRPSIAGAFVAGLAAYAYLPLAASRGPTVNWGNPRSLEGLLWLVTARPYSDLVFGLPLAWLPARLGAWSGEALRQFWPWGCAIAALGLWRLDHADRAWWRCTGLVALAFSIYALCYNTADSYVYLLLTWAVCALWLAYGLAYVIERVQSAAGGFRPPVPMLTREAQVCLAVLMFAFLVLPVASAVVRYGEMDLSSDRAAEDFVAGALTAAQPKAVVFVATDKPTFALWYAIYGLHLRPDVIPINVNLYGYSWYRESMVRSLAPRVASEPVGWPVFVHRLAAERPLYRAEPLPLETAGFHEATVGPLVRLSPR